MANVETVIVPSVLLTLAEMPKPVASSVPSRALATENFVGSNESA